MTVCLPGNHTKYSHHYVVVGVSGWFVTMVSGGPQVRLQAARHTDQHHLHHPSPKASLILGLHPQLFLAQPKGKINFLLISPEFGDPC